MLPFAVDGGIFFRRADATCFCLETLQAERKWLDDKE
jgi:hypothetical protein